MAKKKIEEEAPKGSPLWMNTYSDLVTLLLCFFVLLFSMSNIDVAKFKAFINSFNESMSMFFGGQNISSENQLGSGMKQLPDFNQYFVTTMTEPHEVGDQDQRTDVIEKTKKTAEKFQEFVEENELENELEVKYSENYVKLIFVDGVLFDTGKADLKEDAVDTLELVGEELRQYRNENIKIEGHTDNVPIHTPQFPSNWYLSSARAISVAEYLIHKKEFDPKTLSADGFGEYSPIASNNTPEGRAKNRRVEIKIIYNTILDDSQSNSSDESL